MFDKFQNPSPNWCLKPQIHYLKFYTKPQNLSLWILGLYVKIHGESWYIIKTKLESLSFEVGVKIPSNIAYSWCLGPKMVKISSIPKFGLKIPLLVKCSSWSRSSPTRSPSIKRALPLLLRDRMNAYAIAIHRAAKICDRDLKPCDCEGQKALAPHAPLRDRTTPGSNLLRVSVTSYMITMNTSDTRKHLQHPTCSRCCKTHPSPLRSHPNISTSP